MKYVKFSMLLSALILTGCGYLSGPHSPFPSHENDYLSAKSIPPLRIPPGVASSSFQNLYPIPDRNYPESAKRISTTPPGI